MSAGNPIRQTMRKSLDEMRTLLPIFEAGTVFLTIAVCMVIALGAIGGFYMGRRQ